MDRRQTAYFTIGFGILLLVVVLLLAWGGRRESVGIVLPAAQADTGGMEGNGGESRLNLVEITPETVKPAINTLSRPISYSRVQVVETSWSGGSGQSVSRAWVCRWMRSPRPAIRTVTGSTASMWRHSRTSRAMRTVTGSAWTPACSMRQNACGRGSWSTASPRKCRTPLRRQTRCSCCLTAAP